MQRRVQDNVCVTKLLSHRRVQDDVCCGAMTAKASTRGADKS